MAFNQLRRIIFSFVFFSFICPMIIDAYPYAYRRLVLKKEGKIVKVVDLVSDMHLRELPELSDKLSLAEKQMKWASLAPDQGPTEKALFLTLQKLAQKQTSRSIEFLGESAPDTIQKLGDSRFLSLGGMWLTLHKLWKNVDHLNLLSRKQRTYSRFKRLLIYVGILKVIINRKPIYIHADTYRFIPSLTQSFDYFDKLQNGRVRVDFPEDFLDNQNPIDRDIREIKNIIDVQVYEILEKLWQEYKQRIKCYCSSTSEVNSGCFENDELIDCKYLDVIGITARAMDFEVLMKIFKSPNDHHIVIAGGAHCYQLESWLTQKFGYEETFSFGPKKYRLTQSEIKPLPATTWKHLESDPFSPQTAAAA